MGLRSATLALDKDSGCSVQHCVVRKVDRRLWRFACRELHCLREKPFRFRQTACNLNLHAGIPSSWTFFKKDECSGGRDESMAMVCTCWPCSIIRSNPMSERTLRSSRDGVPWRKTATSQSESGRASPRARTVQHHPDDAARQSLLGAPFEFMKEGQIGTRHGATIAQVCGHLDVVLLYRQMLLPLPGRPRLLHMASTLSITAWSMRIRRPHSRVVSPGHLSVASRPILEPRPETGEAKSR